MTGNHDPILNDTLSLKSMIFVAAVVTGLIGLAAFGIYSAVKEIL